MGRVVNPLLKGITGKIGGLVFYQSGGNTYVRQASGKQSKAVKKRTSKRKRLSQSVMKQTHQFLRTLVPLLRYSFQEMKQGARQPYHAAVAYMAKNSFVREGDQKVIDPSLLKLSAGTLTGAVGATAEWTEEGIKFTWTDNSWTGSALPTDRSLLIAIGMEEEVRVWKKEAEPRQKGEAILSLADYPSEKTWHIYLAFSQEKTRMKKTFVSDSVYLGKVEKPG
ncbi:DUF6266 family protein [Algoriphagus sp. CAU 1675]|uniref:DUF6266 family protein n=1 Tax=Algoriphagus sp. CAU 1675 TaxID=3032597 RepID=UPI0023DC1C66|nr:DUF6266 family protein [Algoriphagus sp. CAU 1675]MDF2156478.1 DUF6266 family protein [Algoriphagus sp. CAU 1675]